MKIFNGLLVFSAIIGGMNCFEWNDLGATIKDEITEEIGILAAPILQVKNDLGDLAVLTKTKISNIGFADVGQILASFGSSDACMDLTNDANTAYQIATNATNFAITAVEEVTSALNKIVDCGGLLVNQLQCIMDNIKIVRQDILDLQEQFQPYKDEAAQTYKTILSDYKNCLKEW